jgi:hypothetical protein
LLAFTKQGHAISQRRDHTVPPLLFLDTLPNRVTSLMLRALMRKRQGSCISPAPGVPQPLRLTHGHERNRPRK